MFHHRAAKPVVQNMILDRADDFHTASEKFERPSVHRLDPARIDQRNGNSFLFKLPRGFFGNLKHVAQSKDRHVAPMLHDFRLADLEKFRFRFDLSACPRTSWIANSDWTGA